MKTKHRLIKVFSSIALVACCAIWVSSARAQSYSLIDLGVLPGEEESTPAAINDQGQVAGTSGDCAFRYTSNVKRPLEDVAARSLNGIRRGFGINSSGLVVGDSTFGKNVTHAAFFRNGIATDLGTLTVGGPFSRANGINASGQVVGFACEKLDSNYGRAFIAYPFLSSSRSNRMIDLGTLGGSYAQAWGINDSGFVTGNSRVDKSESSHAFVWHSKTGMLDLGTLAGDFSYGTFINANNHVVGYSTINDSDDRIHAFLHNGKEMLDLGSLGGASLESDRSFALGVNASDQVVGCSYLPSDGKVDISRPIPVLRQVAFVYSDGLMLNLNDLIGDPVKHYRLDSATAINDKGQIVAIAFVHSAGAYHAVLLTPITDIKN